MAQRRLGDAASGAATASERLASGLRINRASDDAAGLSIAMSLNADSRIYAQAIRNVNDGISAMNVVEGATGQLVGLVTRLRELAEQSANGTYSRTQRLSLKSEADALVGEYNRITQTTKFNGLSLLDRSLPQLSIQAGRGPNSVLSFEVGGELDRRVGDGTFAGEQELSLAGGDGSWIESADINGDGFADLIGGSINGGGEISVILGRGNGTFDSEVAYVGVTGGINLRNGQLVDLNRDGKLDIVTTSSDGASLNVLLGNGNGSFQAVQSYANAGGAWGLGVGDINGDGIIDAVVSSHTTSNISIYLGNGDGTFRARATIQGSGNSNGVVLADINGDGRLDIASTSQSSGAGLDIFFGAGNGTFGAKMTVAYAGAFTVRAGDFNRDGIVDLVTDGANATSLFILTGNGDGTFKVKTAASSSLSRGVRVADVNGDGFDDIIASSETDSYHSVHFGNGDGTFRARTTVSSTVATTDLVLNDFNNDGVLDLFASGQGSGKVFGVIGNGYQTTSIQYLNIMTQAGARDAMNTLETIHARLMLEAGSLGSAQSRLGVAVRTLGSSYEGYRAAESRIMSADVAAEAAELVKRQILQKSAIAILGQANIQPSIALKLLSG